MFSIIKIKQHLCFFSLISMYFILPETENRSLEDIELHYADNSKRITDIEIKIVTQQNKTTE